MKKLLLFIALCVSSVVLGQDYYAILKVPREATTGQIRKAYHDLAKEFHPTAVEARLRSPKQKPPLSEDEIEKSLGIAKEMFQEIQNAYETLIDPAKRSEYDSLNPASGAGAGAAGAAGAAAGAQSQTGLTPEELAPFHKKLYAIIMDHVKAKFSGKQIDDFPVIRSLDKKYAAFGQEFVASLRRKIAKPEDFDLSHISLGLRDILLGQPFYGVVKESLDRIKAQVADRLQQAPPLGQPEARLDALTRLEDEVWFWTYLDQELRDQILRESIALVDSLRVAGKQAEANQLIDETIKAIDQKWGRNFPVDAALRQQLEGLRQRGQQAGQQEKYQAQVKKELPGLKKEFEAILTSHKIGNLKDPNKQAAIAKRYAALRDRLLVKLIQAEKLNLTKVSEYTDLKNLYSETAALYYVVRNEPIVGKAKDFLDLEQAIFNFAYSNYQSLADTAARIKSLNNLKGRYKYLFLIDSERRNELLREYIRLIKDLRVEKQDKRAFNLINNAYDLLNTEWGENFPVSDEVSKGLDQAQTPASTPRPAPSPQPAPRPAPKPDRIPPVELVKIKNWVTGRVFRLAIPELNRYSPQAKAQIINSYITDINEAKNQEEKLRLLDDALALAKAIQADIKSTARALPTFDAAYGRLQTLAGQLRSPQPTPTPAPAVSVPQLGRDLGALQKQLNALTRQLGSIR